MSVNTFHKILQILADLLGLNHGKKTVYTTEDDFTRLPNKVAKVKIGRHVVQQGIQSTLN